MSRRSRTRDSRTALAGGLASYAPAFLDIWRNAARDIGRVLRGANPGDLPVEQPTKFEFLVNLKTAKGARPHDPAVAPAAGGSGDQVMERRAFLAGAVTLLAAPLAAEAQPAAKVYRIGLLIPAPGPAPGVMPPIIVPAFLAGMRERGWLEHQGFVLEPRYAEGRVERLPELATELVRLKVDLIVAMGTPAAMAAKQATTTIPVVFGLVGDAVGSGVVPNLARPGGNVTGMSLYLPEVLGKALEILKEALPGAELVVMTRDPDNRAQNLADANADAVAKARGIRLHRVDVRHVSDYEAAFKMALKQRANAVLVAPQLPLPKQMADFAMSHRLPIMTMITGPGAQVGQLMIYGPNFGDQVRRVTGYVDRILKGARPDDLPVEQVDRFELSVNLKTAKALGLTIPPSVLARADQVIE